jgi:hypothetical protein
LRTQIKKLGSSNPIFWIFSPDDPLATNSAAANSLRAHRPQA